MDGNFSSLRVKDHLLLSVQSGTNSSFDDINHSVLEDPQEADEEDTLSLDGSGTGIVTNSTTKGKKHRRSPSSSSSSSGYYGTNRNHTTNNKKWRNNSMNIALFAILVVVVGFAASASFLYLGITSASNKEDDNFDRRATELAHELKSAWEDYEVAALWIHESCRKHDFDRNDFRALYDYIRSDGLEFQAAEYIPNTTQAERAHMEQEDQDFYAREYPHLKYHGLKGFEPNDEGGVSVQNRSEQPFYFPVRFVEPVEPNFAAAGFDLYSSSSRRSTIHQALETWKPALTDRLQLVQETDPSAYSVLLMHPGVPLHVPDNEDQDQQESHQYYYHMEEEEEEEEEDNTSSSMTNQTSTGDNVVVANDGPRDVSLLVIRIPALLERVSRNQVESFGMYLYDKSVAGSDDNDGDSPPQFLGAVTVTVVNSNSHTDDNKKVVGQEEQADVGSSSMALDDEDITEEREEVESHPNHHHRHRIVEFLPEIELKDLLKEHQNNKLKREDIQASTGKTWEVVVFPVNDAYEPDLTIIVITGVIIAVAAGALAICLYSNMKRVITMNDIILQAQTDKAIVSNLFPSNIRRRLMEEGTSAAGGHGVARGGISGGPNCAGGGKGGIDDSSTIFGSKPLAELYPETTIMFADIKGFTAWSSVRDPTQVFSLLEVLYNGFDIIAKRRSVFKVETIGDCYVACTGLPNPRKDHALIMSRFAVDIMLKMPELTQGLETTLGPDTNELALRIGIHSGPVTAGVLRGDKGRFQLFGDTMNLTSRMESTGQSGRIHVSEATAHLLREAGKEDWLENNETVVHAKGIGHISTFWINIEAVAGPDRLAKAAALTAVAANGGRARRTSGSKTSSSVSSTSSMNGSRQELLLDEKTKKLVEWNVKSLERFLRQIMVRQRASSHKKKKKNVKHPSNIANDQDIQRAGGGMLLDEVKDVIPMPKFDPKTVSRAEEIDPTTVELDPCVLPQLRDYVTKIALLYHSANPFHNFDHASHVTMSVVKLLSRIVNPKLTEIKNTKYNKARINDRGVTDTLTMLHDHTFGITSDPVTQFACVFAAVVHDADHTGLPNSVLVKEGAQIAKKYQNKSVAEQNSLELALNLLMDSKYEKLRDCLFEDEEDLQHFRAVLTNSVMATDIMDKELGSARKKRWEKAFATAQNKQDCKPPEQARGSESTATEQADEESTNRKATIVIEHLIQASDVAHTMQHWHVYHRWNERLFFELYDAYNAGKLDKDPSTSWYEGEKGFFDFYIIPLAKKLKDCGVFGVSSDEYLAYALDNRREWEEKGESITQEYLKKYWETHTA